MEPLTLGNRIYFFGVGEEAGGVLSSGEEGCSNKLIGKSQMHSCMLRYGLSSRIKPETDFKRRAIGVSLKAGRS